VLAVLALEPHSETCYEALWNSFVEAYLDNLIFEIELLLAAVTLYIDDRSSIDHP